jgi:hypothetical protein
MLITRKSIISGIERTMDLPATEEQMEIWTTSKFPKVQDVFPHLTPSQREFILTGITDEEWDAAFSDNEEEPEDDEPAF